MNVETSTSTLADLTHPQAQAIRSAIVRRRVLLADQSSVQETAQVTVGGSVTVKDIITPRELRGLSATVWSIQDGKATYATLLLTEQAAATVSRVPTTMITLPEGATGYLLDGIPVAALIARDVAPQFAALIDHVVSRADIGQLDELTAVTEERLAQFAGEVAVDQRVMLADVARKYLNGLIGVVTHVAEGRFSLLLDEHSTQTLRHASRNSSHTVDNTVTRYTVPRISTACAVILPL